MLLERGSNDVLSRARKTLGSNATVSRALLVVLAMALGAGIYDCSSWDCSDCTAPAECARSCPPDQEFDGCFCIGGEAGADAEASADAEAAGAAE
jgi:hypothetical protein